MSNFRIWYASFPRALRLLLSVNVVAYLLWQIVFIHIGVTRSFVWEHLALNPGLPGILLEPWQLVTYAFLHLEPGLGGLLHILFNMLWLVWIGRDLEDLQGPAPVLGLYLLGGVGGAVLTVVLHALLPGAALFAGTVHGASGAVLAVMTGVAILYPHKQIALLFIGSVRLIHVVIGFLALDILFLAAGGTSVSAHAGGALVGFAFGRLQQAGTDLTAWARPLYDRSPSRARSGSGDSFLSKVDSWLGRKQSNGNATESTRAPESRPAGSRLTIVSPRRAPETDRVEQESNSGSPAEASVDRILDKISESGYDSLTPDEKRILYEASGK